MKARLLAMALCPLLMTGILQAQTTAPATRTLTGIVVDEAGQPVAHVAVVHGYTSAGQTTTSAADGSFSLQVPAETYPYGQTVATETGSRRIASFRQSKVMPGEPVALQRLVLHPARVLSVSVADAAAHPIAGATVAAGESFSNLAQALTDDAGQATLLVPADAPLSYLVAFKHGAGLDYALVWRKDEPHSDPYRLEPDFTAPVKLTLNGAKAFTLHVEDGNHQPLAGVKVHPWYFKKPDRGDDLNIGLSDFGRTTDAGGNATLDYLPADNTQPIAIWFRKEGYFAPERCAYDPARSPATLTATLLPLVPLSGRVVDANGHAVGPATVRIGGAGYQLDHFSKTLTTAADGTFSISVDPDMYYVFCAQKDHDVSFAVATVILRKTPDTPVELTLDTGHRVHGTLTVGPANTPVPDSSIELTYRDDSYRRIPENQRLPNGDNRSVTAFLSQDATTDKDGNFEFYTLPGSHYMRAYADPNSISMDVDVKGADTLVALHGELAPDAPRTFSGRVVLADNPETPVANAAIDSAPVSEQNSTAPSGTARADGTFTLRRFPSDLLLGGRSPDGKFAAAVRIKSTDDNITLNLAPAAIATGRLVDADKKPLAAMDLYCGAYIDLGHGLSTTGLALRTRTDAGGNFTLPGLIPGMQYELSAIFPTAPGQTFSDWRNISSIVPKKPGDLPLGDVTPK